MVALNNSSAARGNLKINFCIGSFSSRWRERPQAVTVPRADRGPQAGSPLGVVDATGLGTQASRLLLNVSAALLTLSRRDACVPRSGRYRSRFCNAIRTLQ